MGQPFSDEAFRTLVTSDSLLARAEQLRATLDGWVAADMMAAARRAFAYLPDDAVIRAKVYPVIKPKTGGPDVHPHATSGPAERATWDRDVAHVVRDMDRLERYFLDLVAESMTEEEARARGFAFVVSDDVPQGAFYTVGWHMSATSSGSSAGTVWSRRFAIPFSS